MPLVALPSPQAWAAYITFMIASCCTWGKIKGPVKSQETES